MRPLCFGLDDIGRGLTAMIRACSFLCVVAVSRKGVIDSPAFVLLSVELIFYK
jgi:hypothetical protein